MATKINDDKEITFNSVYFNGGINYSDIRFKGEVIGCLVERQTSILEPITERYQMSAPEKNQNDFDGWMESEDDGIIFGYFNTLEKFIAYYNLKN